MVITELITAVKSKLTENSEFEAREIVMCVLNTDRSSLIINSKNEVSDEKVSEAMELVQRRCNGEPLQYILGFAEFMSLSFKTSSHTLIPRSDTETLVEAVLERLNGDNVNLLDIGTGTGCIGISIAYYNKNVKATLADFKEEIISLARENAVSNGINAETVCIDILKEIPQNKYDVIVSNPPYIERAVIPLLQTEVRDFEPMTALDGGEDGLIFYRRIIDIAPQVLSKNGRLFFEIGYNQGIEVSELMKKSFEKIEVIKDLCGNDRVVCGRIKEL